jgi:sec-independent protein translocase protein TatA
MNAIFLLGMPGGAEWIVLLAVVLLLFGGSRLPQLAKGLGESIKEFKRGASQEEFIGEIEDHSSRR